MTPTDSLLNRNALRNQYRCARRKLTFQQQAIAEQRITKKMTALPAFTRAKNIALYLPDDGEISTLGIIETAWKMRKRVFLPVIDLHNDMRFVLFAPYCKLSYGKWGMQQPKGKLKFVKPLIFDLIITPLVAFDLNGNRLGRGGGYYDRFLSQFLSTGKHLHKPFNHPRKDIIDAHQYNCRKPFTLGLAHDCQLASLIPTETWDVSLSSVSTDSKLYFFQ